MRLASRLPLPASVLLPQQRRHFGHRRRTVGGGKGRGHAIAGGGSAHTGAETVLPGTAHRRPTRHAIALHPQHPFDDFGVDVVVAADIGQPTLVASFVVDAIQTAGDAAGEGHGDLRAEARGQVHGILHGIAPAAAEVEHAEVGIDFLEIGHRRHDAVFERLDGDDIFHTHAHRVAGEALRVGDDDVVGRLAEGLAQGHHFGSGAAAASRGEGLVRHEHHLRGHGIAVEAKAALGCCHQVLHHQRNVIDIQPGAMKSAVAALAAQQFDDAAHPAFAHGVLTFDHQGAGAHAQQGAVAALVEGQGGQVDAVVGGGGAGGQKARAHPLDQVVAGDVVGPDHDHAAAAARADPVFGDGDGLGRAGAGGVHLRIGAAGADVLGELAVAHGQDAEEEAAVEEIRLALHLLAQIDDAAVDLL